MFTTILLFQDVFSSQQYMLSQSKEAKIVMTIKALECNRKLKVYKAMQIYDVLYSTFHDRISKTKSVTK